jgi:hypothetical protein
MADRTTIPAGRNLFTPQQDVEMGRALMQEVASSENLSRDSYSGGYLTALGNQLAVNAPGYKYPYEFKILNDDRIDSFALPGGFIYVTRGLIEAAPDEPQLAGVLAHQIAHVVLRHGTQQVSKEYQAAVPSAAQGRVSVSTAMNRLDTFYDDPSVQKFSAEFERQADLIGAQLLHDARFDARQMPVMFQRLQAEPANLTADLFQNHPGVNNRAVRIRREVQNLGGLPRNVRGDSPDLHRAQDRLRVESTASNNNNNADDDFQIVDVDPPSTQMVTYRGRDLEFRYPQNWRVSEEGSAISVAPDNGFVDGSLAYGVTISTFNPEDSNLFGQFGLNPSGTRTNDTTLSRATDQLIQDLQRSNPNMREVRSSTRRVDGEAAIVTELSNDSPLGGRETDWLVTVLRPDGLLHYLIGVAPQSEFSRYAPTFDRMVTSIRFYD